jgi:hypothetical protein
MEDYALDVDNLAVKHRAKLAFRSLMAGGAQTALYVRQGLRQENAFVVIACCNILDHVLYEGGTRPHRTAEPRG